MTTRTHINNRYFGLQAGTRVHTRHQLMQRRAVAVALHEYTFTLTRLILERLNRGTIHSDNDPAQFSEYGPLADATDYTVTISSDKAQSELTIYDLLEAIEADENNPVALSGLVWNHVTDPEDDYYLESLTLGSSIYPDVGHYVYQGGIPVTWDGTSWMYFTENEAGPPDPPDNPNGSPTTMAGFPTKTLSDHLLFNGDDQTFHTLVLSYETMVYTWTR